MILAALTVVALTGSSTPKNEVLTGINRVRAEQGLRSLQRVRSLDDASQWFAEDLASRNSNLDHVDSRGRRVNHRIYEFGYRSIHRSAEILALTTSPSMDVVATWMNSPGHRRSILTPEFQHFGIGMATNSEGRTYWVVAFGQRFKGAPQIER